MVKHVCVRNETICLDAFYLDTENATGDHHSNLRILLQRKLSIVRHFIANRVIVLLDVTNLLGDLVLEWATLEPSSFLLCVEDGEVIERFWQNINVLVEDSFLLAALLHNVCRQEGVLGGEKTISVPLRKHLRTDRRRKSHLQRDYLMLRHV